MLCVSTCRKEITPQGKFFPCYLMGHAIRTDPAEGIMDPLWATALVLEAEGERFVWITVELIGLERDYTERLQAEIEKKYGIPPERTFDEKKVYTSALALAKRGLECKPFVLDLVCRYWDLGDLKIMTIPAELFSRFGVQLKQAMGAKCPICWCYSNYSVGYLGNIEDYGASFETAASDIPQGTTEKIVERMVAFLKEEGETK